MSQSKVLFDKIHGYILVDSIALSIIDTYEFQRLRFIKQTGVLNYVFPTAVHTRFEHSIGTYYLANQMINFLKINQEVVEITNEIKKVISIAALCHDLGHVTFSHLFDDLFLKKSTNPLSIHENRSIFILEHIINKYKVDISKIELMIIGQLINPSNSTYEFWPEHFKVGKWIFEIVSNSFCHLDVDKIDYIVRDSRSIGLSYNIDCRRIMEQATIMKGIDGKLHIHYPIQTADDIRELFYTRYRLHKNIYNHKAVKGIEIYIIKILEELDKKLKIKEWINDIDKMILLLDHIIISNISNPVIKNYYEKIIKREFPKLEKEIVCKGGYSEDLENNENHYLMQFKIGLIGKKENPLDLIPFYSIKSNKPIEKIKTLFNINSNHLEYVTRLYKS
tara:strand:+ start:1236 stop:2411 length:1176 start_codon:yes stop_codon:yes gene_type:complete